MHPIMFRIPLPTWHLPWSWLLLAVAGLTALATVWWEIQRRKEGGPFWILEGPLVTAALTVVLLGVVGVRKYVSPTLIFETDGWDMSPIPIYSYGVMLGLSLVVGWYLTLGLAKRDGLPEEKMANNYIFTAVLAVIGSRILYIVTNWHEFENNLGSMFAMRRGGLVAYGGFLGGFVGSLIYLRRHRIPILPWADVAVPSLASGLLITRIGCYMFGCDFGQRLPASAPAWLQKLGSFPRWAPALVEQGGDGAPAWAHHVRQNLLPKSAEYSIPVHPTQLYESLVGALLLVLLLLSRRVQKFRGQIFLIFTFSYGVCRFLLELLRDDTERGSIPPSLPDHILFPAALMLLAIGYVIGFSRMINNPVVQRITQVFAFVPPIVLFVWLRPESFGNAVTTQLSTSQGVAVSTGFAAALAFSVYYKAALAHPESAMDLGLPPETPDEEKDKDVDAKPDVYADDDDERAPASDRPVRKLRTADKPKGERDPGDSPTVDAKKVVKSKTGTKKKKKASPSATSKSDTLPQASEGDAFESTKKSSADTDDSTEDR